MNNSDIYRHADEALLEDMDGELLLYHPPSAMTLHLNGSSAVVWQLCDGKRSIAEIVQLVTEAYPEQAEQIPGDVQSVIEDLLRRNVLVKAS